MALVWFELSLVVLTTYILHADGCWRHQDPPGMDTTTPAYVEMATEPQASVTTPVRAHRVPCTRHEVNRTRCLQGSCTAVIIVAESRTVFCSCFPGWEGLRCEFKSQYPYLIPSTEQKVEGASVALSILVAMIIIGLVIFACFWYSSKYGVDRRPLNGISLKGEGQPNGRHKIIEVNGMEQDTSNRLLQTVSTVS